MHIMKRILIVTLVTVLIVGVLSAHALATEEVENISTDNAVESLQITSSARNYIGVIEEAIENAPPYDSETGGKGMLYDVDGNGVQELIMLHYIEDTIEPGYLMPCLVFSVYTMKGSEVIPLIENEQVCVIAGQPSGTAAVVEISGTRYLGVKSTTGETFSIKEEWKLYTINGTSITLNSKVECVSEWDVNTGALDNSNSYTYIDGVKYNYDAFDEWEDKLTSVEEIHYALEGGTTLVDLLAALKATPEDSDDNENAVDYNARNYIGVVEAVIGNAHASSWSSAGDGLLYDVDGNGAEELIMVHLFDQNDFPHIGFSIYAMGGETVIPCITNQALVTNAGGPIAEAFIIEENGKKYIAVHGDNGNTDGSGYRAGDWYVYSVEGTSVQLETEINYYKWNEGDWENGFHIDYSKSYAYFNGLKYSYSKLEQWEEDLRVLVDIGYLWDDAYNLEDLLEYLKSLPESNYNGLVEVNGIWGYYIDGVLQKDYTGFVKEDGIYYYVQNGILDREFYGLVCVDGHWRYVEEGYVTWKYKGLAEYNGEYFYVEQSSVNWEYTGFVLHEGVYYYIQNGYLDWGFSGLVYIDGHWRYVEEGRITWKYKGLGKYNGEYFYIENSSVNWEYTGFVLHKGVYYYIQNGHLDWSFSGLVCIDGHWRYVEGGLITWKYNGLGRYDGEYFYIENSSVNWEYTGLVWHNDRYYYIENGHLDWSFWGLAYKSGNWWYVENGYVTGNYTGLGQKGGEYFYVKDSILDWSYTGLLEHSGKMYYIQNGHLDWSYTGLGYHKGEWLYIYGGRYKDGYYGLVYFNNNWFYVEDSVLTWENHGLHECDGKLYYLNHSQVDWSYNGPAHYKGVLYEVVNGVAEL